MWKSSNKILASIAFSTFAILGCNKKDSKPEAPASIAESPAKVQSADSATGTSDTSQSLYPISIEGYQASKLGEAIHSGDLEKFKSLVQSGMDREKCLTDDTYEYDALYAAIAFQKLSILEYLLQSKSFTDINRTYSEDSETPLTLASAIEDTTSAQAICKLLISNGANVNGSGPSGGEETKVPVEIAKSRSNGGLVKMLVEGGAKPPESENAESSD